MRLSSIIQFNKKLYIHQQKAKNKILHAWDEYNSVMLQMPTGTGKTYLFISLISDILNHYKENHLELNILIVAHRTELLDQISSSLNKYGITHGFIQGSREQHLWQRIQVGSIMSLFTSKNKLRVKRLNFDYIIIDEAHHSLAESYKRLFEIFPNAKKLGVTATPWRFNHETFATLYQTLITTPQISWFIKNGLLADFDYISIKPDSITQKTINNSKISQMGDYVNTELEKVFNNQKIRSNLLSSYKKFANGRKGIVYAINKKHAASIAEMYNLNGFKSVSIDCDTPKEERVEFVNAFKQDKIKILVNVDIFTEGFDCPDVSFIQLARPTRSLALYLQQVGRGLRVVANKEKTIILDNVGLYNYFGLPDAKRHWNYHFIGHEVDYKSKVSQSIENDSEKRQERNLKEDNEEMLVIRGSQKDEILSNKKEVVNTTPSITEFTLCNYYLIRGDIHSFKIYSLIKRKGVITQEVSSEILEYNTEDKPLTFSNDTANNIEIVSKHPKIQTIIMFVCTLCNINYQDSLNLKYISERTKVPLYPQVSLYELLVILENIFQKSRSTHIKVYL